MYVYFSLRIAHFLHFKHISSKTISITTKSKSDNIGTATIWGTLALIVFLKYIDYSSELITPSVVQISDSFLCSLLHQCRTNDFVEYFCNFVNNLRSLTVFELYFRFGETSTTEQICMPYVRVVSYAYFLFEYVKFCWLWITNEIS